MNKQTRKDAVDQTHIFDRRRLFYLRFGFNSSTMIDRYPQLYGNLLGKSRDEIEQFIQLKEQELQAHEYRQYLFFIFDLQRYFKDRLTRFMPHSFHQHELDPLFLEEYCALNGNSSFWAGYNKRKFEKDNYLIRYLLMYFDYNQDFRSTSRFQYSHAHHRRPNQSPPSSMNVRRAAEIFSLRVEKAKNISKKELTSLYRKKAHSMHPDKGGDSEQFVELTEAYDELLRFLS